MDSQHYEKLMEDLANWFYDYEGVEWHNGTDVVDMGDDGDGYVAYDIETIELENVPRIFTNDETQGDFEEHIRSVIEEVGDE